jgi:5-methylcytosine-specific restriction endonuclease McrA
MTVFAETHLSDDDIAAMWDAGETMTDIARSHGLSRERIRQRLKRTGREGTNPNRFPAAPVLSSLARESTSLAGMAAALGIAITKLDAALDHHGLRSAVLQSLEENRREASQDQRRVSQQRYIGRLRKLAAEVGHTPTASELQDVGIHHVVLTKVFGAVPDAMIQAGLFPNEPGRPPQSLPPEFWEDYEPTADTDILDARVNRLRQLGILHEPPTGNSVPTQMQVTSHRYVRDPSVVAWILEHSGGVCEACGTPGYETDDGTLFLEVHHVVPLSESGPDIITNAIAVCETCHGKLHRWNQRDQRTEALYTEIPRLVRPG